MEEEIHENQCEATNPSSDQERTEETSISAMQAAGRSLVSTQSFSSLLTKALSAVLHPAGTPGPNSDPQLGADPERNASPDLERLETELRDLRDQLQQMKTQHNKEIKLLMNELDEEKRIRLTLQMEIQRIKKHMSK